MSKRSISKTFLKGLFVTMPLLLTLVFFIWVIKTADSMLAQPIKILLPEGFYFPGIGIAVGLILIYSVGLAIHGRVTRAFFLWLDELIKKLPLVNVLYTNINEMIEFISGEKEGELERVVLVNLSDDMHLMGFVTQDEPEIENGSNSSLQAVFLPMSYQMGGYLIYVDESRLTNLDISKKEAMQKILTADIGKNGNQSPLKEVIDGSA